MNFEVSVVITTYNRSRLLGRAIQSTFDQAWPELEVLVVDDASTDDTPELVRRLYPQVRYLRQDSNRGVGAARNRALREASQPWVVFLDDDDTLLHGALARIAARIMDFSDAERYPLLQFAHGNGSIPQAFMIARMAHLVSGAVHGDFVPAIRKERFLSEGLAYPELAMGGECLLYFQVAEKYGIPTWSDRVGSVHTDAPVRITSADNQVRNPQYFAEIQECMLSEFGEILASRFPAYYHKKLLGAATYRLLAKERGVARSHLRLALRCRFSLEALGLWALSFSPRAWTEKCLAAYRRCTNGSS